MTQPHKARKRFGQNFLRDALVIERIVGAVNPRSGQHLLEIGPGQGALTSQLLALLPGDALLTVVELDRDLVVDLQAQADKNPQFEVISADVLKVDLLPLREQAGSALSVCGNLPYNISTPLLLKMLEAQLQQRMLSGASQEDFASSLVFMLQREVVERICASEGSKSYGRLSVVLGAVFELEFLFDVGPEAFTPPPKVTSAVVRLVPRRDLLVAPEKFSTFQRLVTSSFAQRRKTLKNNLKGIVGSEQLESISIDPSRRPETLSIDEFVAITDLLDNT